MMTRHVLLAFAVCANFAADAFSYHGPEECPSPPKVSVITDAVTNDGVLNDASKFWTLWREGAAAAAAEVDFRGFYKIELQSIDVQAYVDGIASACETADAIVVSVPLTLQRLSQRLVGLGLQRHDRAHLLLQRVPDVRDHPHISPRVQPRPPLPPA